MSESGGDRSSGKTAGGEEDFTSTTEVVIKRVDNECTNTAGSQKDDRVDCTDNPFVSALTRNTEFLGVRQVGTI